MFSIATLRPIINNKTFNINFALNFKIVKFNFVGLKF